ncbi:MAG: GNAT family N-acetyltransferase [Spirochaetes bacterium]|nr:GNAT family N-acetyltransferase [Spirochaetota bacterium]
MYKIRKMEIEDYVEIIKLWKHTDGIGIDEKDDSKESIKIFLRKNPNTCFVAITANGEIIGTVMGGNDGRRGHIYHLMVKAEYRNNGIAKDLLKNIEKGFETDGIRKIFLVAYRDNEIGNNFWENNGYKIREDLNYRDKRIIE